MPIGPATRLPRLHWHRILTFRPTSDCFARCFQCICLRGAPLRLTVTVVRLLHIECHYHNFNQLWHVDGFRKIFNRQNLPICFTITRFTNTFYYYFLFCWHFIQPFQWEVLHCKIDLVFIACFWYFECQF